MSQEQSYCNEEDKPPKDVIIVHMDIRQPLRDLQKKVEQKIAAKLSGYKFLLQESQELEPHKNLVDQCVKGEGLVQINVQVIIEKKSINIVDVLKPTEAALAAMGGDENRGVFHDDLKELALVTAEEAESECEMNMSNKEGPAKDARPALNWRMDNKFKKEQLRLKIPEDPEEWTQAHVQHWLMWAIKQFNLTNILMRDWTITGKQLCAMTHPEFCKKMPNDSGNVFWTHIQLLKECKFVSVVHEELEEKSNTASEELTPKEPKIMRKSVTTTIRPHMPNAEGSPQTVGNAANCLGVGTGNNGQVQLWQFLLEILTDREHRDIISWVGTEGEFKLTKPELVATLWGVRKNKPTMNYEKLSRALRYYYDGDMISKVSNKRFAYKFDCDLKLLIGYDAGELSRLVNEDCPFGENSQYYIDQLRERSDDE